MNIQFNNGLKKLSTRVLITCNILPVLSFSNLRGTNSKIRRMIHIGWLFFSITFVFTKK